MSHPGTVWILRVAAAIVAGTVVLVAADDQRRGGTPPPPPTGQRRGAPPPTPTPTPTPQGAQATNPQNPQTPPVFRSEVNLVPIDIRVIDRAGNPVTNLTETDFVIRENNVRQPIRHFSTTNYAPVETAGAGQPLVRTEDATPIGTQNRRVFLIVFGRGRLQAPGAGVDAALELIKNRLLPQDYIGILAWNRATDFTTDHAKILAVAERFKKGHERVESMLRSHFSGLTAVYGGPEIPAKIQKEIDTVFGGSSMASLRELPASPVANAGRVADDTRRITDALQSQALAAGGSRMTSLSDTTATMNLDLSFDEFAELNSQSMQDVTTLYTGISYLRHLGGEKQLLFVSESGVFVPRAEDDRSLAAAASDARVVLNILHTGGTSMRPGIDWRIPTSRTVADLSGGQFTSVQTGPAFVARLDSTSRFSYTVGYYPTNNVMDGAYRRIQISLVNRPGLRVLYRHGYFARQFQSGFDRQRMITYSRVSAAATYGKEVKDLALVTTATPVTAPDGSMFVTVQVQIAPERLALMEANGRKKGAIDVAVFCADKDQHLIGTAWETVVFEMTPEAHGRFMQKGLTYTGKVPVSVPAKHVKVVVYDAGSDLVGSAMLKLK